MTLIRIIGGNSIPATGAHAHYDGESVKAGVVNAWPLRSNANINAADFTGTNDYTYDSVEDGAKSGGFTGSTFTYTNDNEMLNLRFDRSIGNDDSTYTDSWLSYQLEFMMNADWNSNSEGRTSMKAWRLYDIGNTGGGTDPRVVEMQVRQENTQSDVVALPTVRTYECTVPAYSQQDPLRGDAGPAFDWQPSLEAAAINSEKPYPLADHNASTEKPFLVVADKWIRYTVNWDLTNDELTVIMSDEDTDPVIVCADPTSADTGFSLNRNLNSHNPVANELKFEYSTSDEGLTVSGTQYIWVRNVIISSQQIAHGGRPIG